MVEFEEITPEELKNYTTKLAPRLLRVPPYRWTRIDTIAKDVGRFIDICQCLAYYGFFDDHDGWLILEIYKDSLVRLDPMYIRTRSANPLRLCK